MVFLLVINLSDYVAKEELQAKLNALNINRDLSAYAAKEELVIAISGIDLSAYALRTEITNCTFIRWICRNKLCR